MILIPLRGPMVTSRGYVLVRRGGHHKTGVAAVNVIFFRERL
jgi:hypothetical protein